MNLNVCQVDAFALIVFEANLAITPAILDFDIPLDLINTLGNVKPDNHGCF
jgi:hypothetical protein